jgi:hypothetical protein
LCLSEEINRLVRERNKTSELGIKVERDESIVLLIKFNKTDKATVEKAVESFSSLLSTKETIVEKIYQSDDKKIISALENILALTK